MNALAAPLGSSNARPSKGGTRSETNTDTVFAPHRGRPTAAMLQSTFVHSRHHTYGTGKVVYASPAVVTTSSAPSAAGFAGAGRFDACAHAIAAWSSATHWLGNTVNTSPTASVVPVPATRCTNASSRCWAPARVAFII